MKTKSESKPVVIAEGKLVLSGRKFQYILQGGVKRLVWGKNCIKIAMLFILSSCTDFTDQQHYYVDNSLKYFADRFFNEAKVRGINLSKDDIFIELFDLPSPELGVTTSSKVRIDRSFFETHSGNTYNDITDTLYIEYVVFHEMGHYILHKSHVSNNVYSIMTKDGFWLSDYQNDPKKRTILIDELFKL